MAYYGLSKVFHWLVKMAGYDMTVINDELHHNLALWDDRMIEKEDSHKISIIMSKSGLQFYILKILTENTAIINLF